VKLKAWLLGAVLAALSFGASAQSNGCTVLLCLAGNWKNISQCVPPVRDALRDLARGRAFPTCAMSGGPANSAAVTWMGPETCPPMYSYYDGDRGTWAGCNYAGAINVRVNGADWAQVFWNFGGDTSTLYSPDAKRQLGDSIDPTYDRDLAAWLRPPPPVNECWWCN